VSTETRTRRARATERVGVGSVDQPRAVALAGLALLTAAFFSVLYHFVDVTGSPVVLVVEAGAVLGAATLLSRSLRVRVATAVSVGLLVVGLTVYVLSLPNQPPLVPLVTDALSLATGRSLLQVNNVQLWVLGVAPGPLFLTAYLGLRRRYVPATLVGGATLSFLVLTGDAGSVTALLGVVGGTVAVGVGDVDRRGDDLASAEALAVLLALMILVPAFVTVVPGGPSRTLSGPSGIQGGPTAGTVEASLVNADSQISAQGSISLSPEVRFRVESGREGYWQVASYDRYTGNGWVRTGGTSAYDGSRLDGPPGGGRTVTQEYTPVEDLGVLPAAWRPVEARGAAADAAQVTSEGGFAVDGQLAANETYTVRSRVVDPDAGTLRAAGDDYPAEVTERYTRLPSSTPDRVTDRTDRITANADNPYDTARVVERWLENNKNYSLAVERPSGDMADAFLFEMEAGYCTYFATAMVTMLRSQDVPARLAVGYTPGERVGADKWVVRGYNAHAWVQVYFPDVGWVRFDPTPAGPRQGAEQSRLDEARSDDRSDVDLGDTGGSEWTPTETATPAPLTPPPDDGPQPDATPAIPGLAERAPSGPGNAPAPTTPGVNATDDDGSAVGSGGGPGLPSREEATLLGIALFGLLVGVRRSSAARRVYRAVWLRYQPGRDPAADARRAFERLEVLLAQQYRPRRPGETPRQYLDAVDADERARRVAHIHERAQYAGTVTREEADEAVGLVDELVPRRPTAG